ncbi:MAG: hypothetical protein QN200_06505 [Armatimonadota bacterium]|nr:hypothetical protein [Armatimonadota bacterium]MDR7445258.1 hypothetical protein [Armatimonadota bacterium]MDR7614760.1 hypothetical protein [Armatimonadota bacterium]
MRRGFLLVAALVLAACGGFGGSPGAACPTGPAPPGTNTLRGVVVEGMGTDGQVSGRPIGCARVTVETENRTVVVYTDASGVFDTGLGGSFAYAIHVLPPDQAGAAALSVYDLHTSETQFQLRIALPLRKPAGSPPPGSQPRPAVRGRLLNSSGFPQPGFLPRGEQPGSPGTLGFVWWGAYGNRTSPPWMDSGITNDDGTFEVWTDSVARHGSTRPFFAGNYTGRSPSGDVQFFREYALIPSVSLPPDGSAEAGTVRLAPVTASLLLLYDTAARDVLRALGRNGFSFVYVLARPQGELDDLELAQAYTGPFIGQLAVQQEVPVPPVLGATSPFVGVFALGYAYDATVQDGTGEVSVTRSPFRDGSILVSYLQAPGAPAWDAGTSSFRWTPAPGAGAHEVNLRDSAGRPVWVGVRGGDGGTARLPFSLLRPGSFVYVYATDSERPAGWVLGRTGSVVGISPARTLRAPIPLRVRPSAVLAREPIPRTIRESYSRTVFIAP